MNHGNRLCGRAIRRSSHMTALLVILATSPFSVAGPAHAQARSPTAGRGLRPIHRVALPAAAVGTVLPLVSLLPMLPAFRSADIPGSDNDGRWVFLTSYCATTIGVGFGQMMIGTGIETLMTRRIERGGLAGRSTSPFGRALAGQSLGYVTALLASLPGFAYGWGKMDPPDHFVTKTLVAMHLAPALVQAWGGSYLGAAFIERTRPSGQPGAAFVPILSTMRGDPRSFFLGVAGRF